MGSSCQWYFYIKKLLVLPRGIGKLTPSLAATTMKPQSLKFKIVILLLKTLGFAKIIAFNA